MNRAIVTLVLVCSALLLTPCLAQGQGGGPPGGGNPNQPPSPGSSPVAAELYTVFDSSTPPQQVGTAVGYFDGQYAAVQIELPDGNNVVRKFILWATPRGVYSGGGNIFWTGSNCAGTPYARESYSSFFPGTSEQGVTALQGDGRLELYTPTSDQAISAVVQSVNSAHPWATTKCNNYPTSNLTELYPVELIHSDLLALFPPPYDAQIN